MAPAVAKGTSYGTPDYLRYFLREFLFMLRAFETIPRWHEGRTPPPAWVDDFYSGFEGEPEITVDLLASDGVRCRVRLWEGHFDAIMRNATPGCWRSPLSAGS